MTERSNFPSQIPARAGDKWEGIMGVPEQSLFIRDGVLSVLAIKSASGKKSN